MKKLILTVLLSGNIFALRSQVIPELEAADVISASLPLVSINQTCDVYKTKPATENSNIRFIHTPYFAFKRTNDGKLDVRTNKVSATKTEIILTLLCSPQELKKAIADYIRIDAINRNKRDLMTINETDITTPNFISLTVEDVTPESDMLFPANNTVRNIYVSTISLTKTVNSSDANKLVEELRNGEREVRFKVSYKLNAKFLVSSSQVYADVANIHESKAFQDLKGAANAFSWAANYSGGSVTKAATTLTRNQKQNFEGRIKQEISIVYDIDTKSDDFKFLQEQVEKYGQDLFKKASVDLTKGDFAKEISRLSSYSFAPEDIKPDEINEFVSKIKDYLMNESKTDLDIGVKASGGGFFGLISADLDTKVTKNEFVKQLRDNGWDIEQKGKTYIPKSIEVWMLNETALKQNAAIKVRVNKSLRDAFQQTLEISTKENSYKPELQNFAVFYQTFLSNSCPIGSILPFAGPESSIPNGWKLCNGEPLDTASNRELFSVIGYIWGTGLNGRFQIPDLRGAFLRGVDYGKGLDEDGGRRLGTFQGESFLNHAHKPYGEAAYFITQAARTNDGGNLFGGGGKVGVPNLTGESPTGGKETRPDNYAVNFIIRCK